MEITKKKPLKLNSHRRITGKVDMEVILFCFTLILLLIMHYFGVYHKGYDVLSKELWIIILVFLGVVETINQISYYLSKSNETKAKIFKVISFYICFLIGVFSFIGQAIKLEGGGEFRLVKEIPFLILLIGFSWFFSFYSLNTNIRFLFLIGKFRKKN
jgi:hypothetical protein